jgi:hypothetical protein
MKIRSGGCVLMLSLALCGCGAAPSGTSDADRAVTMSTYSGSRSGAMAAGEDGTSSTIYINGVPLSEIAANAARLNIDLAAAAPASLPHMDTMPRPPLENSGAETAKSLSVFPTFRNVTSVSKGMPTSAF